MGRWCTKFVRWWQFSSCWLIAIYQPHRSGNNLFLLLCFLFHTLADILSILCPFVVLRFCFFNMLPFSGWVGSSCPWVLVLMVLCTLSPSCRLLFTLVAPFRARSLRGGLHFKAALLPNGTLVLVNGCQLCCASHRHPRLSVAL